MTWPALTAGSCGQVGLAVSASGCRAEVRLSIMIMSASYLSTFSQLSSSK